MNFRLFLYKLKRPFHFVKTGLLNGLRGQLKFGFPNKKLTILAVTGTDGKTTSSTMLYHILKENGYKVALLSTVAAYIGDKAIDTGFHVTTPQPYMLQELMAQMVEQGVTHLVLEVTSHAEYQYRTWGITPTVAGLTNIAREHLDYHVTYEEYVAAKLNFLQKADTVVVNDQDESYPYASEALQHTKVLTYNQHSPVSKQLQQAITSRFPEYYNQLNAKMVAMMCAQLELSDTQIAKALKTFPGVPGRYQDIPNKRDMRVVVDFAHTPQALHAVLTAAKGEMRSKKSKLIAMFGCASKRDTYKRPVMTQDAVEIADYVIITADDPRDEDVWCIFREMKEQLKSGHDRVISIPNRQDAIYFAINQLAGKGDTVVLASKGHEQSIAIGSTEYPWDEATVAAAALARKEKPFAWYEKVVH